MTWPFAYAFATILFLLPVRLSAQPTGFEFIVLAVQWTAIIICYGLGIADLLGAPIGGCRI